MAAVTAQLRDLTSQIQQLSTNSSTGSMAAAAPVPAPTSTVIHAGPGLRLASPVRYSGEPGRCKTFLTECDMHFEFSPPHFLTDRAKVGFIISNLGGRAQTWATAEWGRNSTICQTLQGFQQAIRRTFDPVGNDRDTARQLCGLRRGKDTVSDYTITHATEPVSLHIGEHKELLTCYVYRSDTRTLVLGYPWLIKHNPHIDWSTGRVTEWSRGCQGKCVPEKNNCTHHD